jgi:hypothetical protein
LQAGRQFRRQVLRSLIGRRNVGGAQALCRLFGRLVDSLFDRLVGRQAAGRFFAGFLQAHCRQAGRQSY